MADLELRQDGDVVWATMNRPDRLNALSRNLGTELREFFVGLYWRRDVRVGVLQGAGDNFCAGLDLKERGDPQGSRSIGAGLTRQREISEIVIAMRYDYIDVAEVVAFLKAEKPPLTHVCLTGRGASEALIEAADLVTEMTLVKHPFRSGIKAQPGVEF